MTKQGALRALACSVVLTACGGQEPGARLTNARVPIVYGEPSPAGGVEDAVLLLRTAVDGQELLCTASLVAKNLALTARHCLAHLIQGPFNCTVRGELIDNPDGAGRIGLDLPANTLEFYGGSLPRGEPVARGSSIVSTFSDTICVNDIAFVVLDRMVDLPLLPLRLSGSARVGEAVTFVGYGMDETQSDTIDFRTQERRRKTGLTIAAIGPDSLDQGVTTVAPRTLVVEGPSGCVADSGGPLLDAATRAVVGVYSTLDGMSCVDPSVRHEFVHVPPFWSLAEDAFRSAGAAPNVEPLPVRDAGSEADADSGSTPAVTPTTSGDGCSLAPRREHDSAASASSWSFVFSLATLRCIRLRRRSWKT